MGDAGEVSQGCECGGRAEVPRGDYTVVGDALHLISDTHFTRHQIDRLRAFRAEIVGLNKPNDATIPNEVIDALADITPVLGASLRLIQNGKGGWLLLILFMYLVIKQFDGDDKPVVNYISKTNVTNVYNFSSPTISYYVNKSGQDHGGKNPKATARRADSENDKP